MKNIVFKLPIDYTWEDEYGEKEVNEPFRAKCPDYFTVDVEEDKEIAESLLKYLTEEKAIDLKLYITIMPFSSSAGFGGFSLYTEDESYNISYRFERVTEQKPNFFFLNRE